MNVDMIANIPRDPAELDEYTADELRQGPATELDITGRWDMTKQELIDSICNNYDTMIVMLEEAVPFVDMAHVTPGDMVVMNHLVNPLEVIDGEFHGLTTDEPISGIIEMETNRGGKHAIQFDQDSVDLLRWRANDDEWMKNSTPPEYFRLIDEWTAQIVFGGHFEDPDNVDAGDLTIPQDLIEEDDNQYYVRGIKNATVEAATPQEAIDKLRQVQQEVDIGDFTRQAHSCDVLENERNGETVEYPLD